jgi:hypothetical protein
MRFPSDLTYVFSKMSGDLFVLSVERGYDSYKFAEIALNTPLGTAIYDDINPNEWLLDTWLMGTYELNFKIPKGETLDSDIMWYAGYLYRYWGIVEDIPIKKIYSKVPLKFIADRYGFYHTQGESYVIADIKETVGWK